MIFPYGCSEVMQKHCYMWENVRQTAALIQLLLHLQSPCVEDNMQFASEHMPEAVNQHHNGPFYNSLQNGLNTITNNLFQIVIINAKNISEQTEHIHYRHTDDIFLLDIHLRVQ